MISKQVNPSTSVTFFTNHPNYDDFRHYYDGFMTTFLSDIGHPDRLTTFLVKNYQEKTTLNLKIHSSIF